MHQETLIKLLYELNGWWEDSRVPRKFLPDLKRNAFGNLLALMEDRQIISVIGPRRVGKTTLLYQMIDHLISVEKVNAKRVLYFSFDELIASEGADAIEDIFNFYFRSVLESGPKELVETVYIILDEVQYVANWQALLKRFYDLKYKIKFIVSGSSATDIKFKAKESLAGRIYDIVIGFLPFREYTRLKGLDVKEGFTLRDKPAAVETLYHKALAHEGLLRGFLAEYIIKGGFPELLYEKDLLKAQQYILNSSLEKVIYKDLVVSFGIKDTRLLSDILTFAASNSSGLFEILTLSRDLKSTRITIANYLSYLKDAFLIDISRNYSKSKLKGARTNKKIYVTDPGIISSLLKHGKDLLNDKGALGAVVETIVFNDCSAIYENVHFWRDGNRAEVDVVVTREKEPIPIEVKYKTNLSHSNLSGMRTFMSKFKTNRGVVVTEDIFKIEANIIHIPLWFFLSYLT